MIQEQITTSSPKCLDGNAGFGVVAQTAGMAPNVAKDIGMLSGYSHLFPAGDANNPVAFLHVVRRSGGTDRHVISRVADCGNDYSGRTNRIGHHWVVEDSDLPSLPCGPAAIASQSALFCTKWNEKSQELPRGKKLPNPPVAAKVCRTWQRWLGDAGWGGVVAERIEKGDPISIIFEPGTDPLPLVDEALALLPPSLRWKTTFSTFFMRSQEPPGTAKIQVKCIVIGSDEMAFAKLTPNTLLIDLRQKPTEVPFGKYVELARTGQVAQPAIPIPTMMPTAVPEMMKPTSDLDISQLPDYEESDVFDIATMSVPQTSSSPFSDRHSGPQSGRKGKKKGFPWLFVSILAVLALMVPIVVFLIFSNVKINELRDITRSDSGVQKVDESKSDEQAEIERKEAEAKAAEEKAKKERQEAEAKAAEEKAKKERQEAEAKVAEEKAEKERQEAERKAEAEKQAKAAEKKAEKEKKAVEEAQIKNLPAVWSGIALPQEAIQLNQTKLAGSDFLWNIKDRVKLDIVTFVDLDAQLPNIDKPVKVDVKDHVIEFSRTETGISGNPRDVPMLRFVLNQSGLSYQWDIPANYNSLDFHRELNRFLLSKLLIMIDGKVVKEIFLWAPEKYSSEQFKEERKKDESFALWKPQEGKEFILSPDEVRIFFDFKEVLRGEEAFPVIEPKMYVQSMLCFAPKIPPIDGKEGVYMAMPTGNDLKLKTSFIPNSQNEILKEMEKINNQKAKVQKEFGDRRLMGWRKLEKDLPKWQNELNRLDPSNARSNPNAKKSPRIMELETDIFHANTVLREKASLDANIKSLKDRYDAMEKQFKAEGEKWKDVKVENFSIYLLKSGTAAEDVGKSENQLLLFQVGTP